MAASIFDATNLYLGVGVGEHLGYLFTGVWTLLVAALIFPAPPHPVGERRRPQPRRHGRHAGALRRAHGAADINAIGFSLWALWALVLGVVLLIEGRSAASPQRRSMA